MQITTTPDIVGEVKDHPLAENFQVFRYRDGALSYVPRNCFINWFGGFSEIGQVHWGKACTLGEGSKIRFDDPVQSLKLGNFVAGGRNLSLILNGMHNINYMGMYIDNFPALPAPHLGDMVIENDVWIGDETMILGGSTISNGTILGARSLVLPQTKLEPFGIYAGNPAKLIRFRFDPKVIALLLDIKWWDRPLPWIHGHARFFQFDLTADLGKSLEMLTELKQLAGRSS